MVTEYKTCRTCGQTKPLDAFYTRPTGAPFSACKACTAAQQARYYQTPRGKEVLRNNQRRLHGHEAPYIRDQQPLAVRISRPEGGKSALFLPRRGWRALNQPPSIDLVVAGPTTLALRPGSMYRVSGHQAGGAPRISAGNPLWDAAGIPDGIYPATSIPGELQITVPPMRIDRIAPSTPVRFLADSDVLGVYPRRGEIRINLPQWRELGSPNAVDIVFDEKLGILGIQPADASFPVHQRTECYYKYIHCKSFFLAGYDFQRIPDGWYPMQHQGNIRFADLSPWLTAR